MPALELFSVSSRRGQLSYAWVRQYSFVPEGLLSFLVPDIFGTDVGVRYWGRWNLWETSPYVGVVAFGLAFIALLRGRGAGAFLPGWIALICAFGLALIALLRGRGAGAFLPGWIALICAFGLALIALLRGTRGKAFVPGCIALICLLLAMAGDWLFFGLIPGFDLFRAQARWLCPASLFIGLVAGLGADGIAASAGEGVPVEAEKSIARSEGSGIWILACLAILLILAGGALCSEMGFGRAAWVRFMDAMFKVAPRERVYLHDWTPSPDFKLAAMRAAGLSILRAGLFLGALAGLVRLTRRSPVKPAWVAGALLALVAIDAWTFGQRYLVTFDPRKDGLSQGAVEFLASRPELFRFWRGGCGALPACEGMTHHFASIEGVQPNAPARFRDVFWSFQGQAIYRQAMDKKFTSYFIYDPQPVLLMLNLRYVVVFPSQPKMQIEGLRTVYQDRQIRIDELPDSWPRAWLVHRYGVVSNRKELLDALPSLNYEKAAFLEEEPGCAVEEPSAAEAAPEIVRYEPARIDIKVQAGAPALLVLSDLFYPGWEATVDGRPAEVLQANYVMRAVAVPTGAHEVRFLYRPASFRAGLAASAAGCLAVALLISWRLWPRRRHGDT
jgi:hypothetical protein